MSNVVSSNVVSSDGTIIAFDRSGEGPPIILVDGELCYRASGPNGPLAELLAPHFTVFTYDRRGRGDSGDTPPYAVDREVEDLEALINEAGGSAYVYGISSGAALALEAANRGLAIKKLALYEAPFVVDDSRPPVPEDYLPQVDKLIAADRRGDAVKLFMRKGVRVPAVFVTMMQFMPAWSKLKGVAHTLPYDAEIMGLPARQTIAGTAVGLRQGADARGGRWEEPRVDAPRGAGARRRPPQCPAPHAGRADAHRQTGSARSGAGGVLPVRFRATIRLGGKTATGIRVPDEVVATEPRDVTEARSAETRQRRIAKAVSMPRGGRTQR